MFVTKRKYRKLLKHLIESTEDNTAILKQNAELVQEIKRLRAERDQFALQVVSGKMYSR